MQLHLSDLLFDLSSLQHRKEPCDTQSMPGPVTINIEKPQVFMENLKRQNEWP